MDKRRDMTVGSVWKELLLFSLPIMAGQFLQQLYNTVDSIVVSHYGGATQEISDAMFAAVGSCTSLIFLFLAISLGLANGGGVLVAQLYGARRETELRRAASTLLITQGALGTALAVFGCVGAEMLVVGLMRVTDEASRDYAIEYFAIYAVGLIFQYIYNAVAGILRAVGDSKASMYFLIVSAVLNTILDLWFVISFGWGVVGVAVATVIAQAVCAAFSIFYMFRRYPIFRFKRHEFVFDRGKFRLCLKLGIPAIIQQAVVSLGNVFIQRLVNSFGQVTMSAFNAGNRMESYALIPIFGMNNAEASFTGQNVGAEKYDRVKRGWAYGTAMSCAMSVVIAVLLYFLAPDFARLFSLSGEALSPGGAVPALDELLRHTLCGLHADQRPAAGRRRRRVDKHEQLRNPCAPCVRRLSHGLRLRRGLRRLLAEHTLWLGPRRAAERAALLLRPLEDEEGSRRRADRVTGGRYERLFRAYFTYALYFTLGARCAPAYPKTCRSTATWSPCSPTRSASYAGTCSA